MSRVSTSCACGRRCRHAQDWLVGENQRPFRHRVHVAGEAKRGKIVEQPHPEPAAARQPLDLLRREAQLFEVERLLEPGRHHEAASGREVAEEELEYRGLRLAMIQVGLNHVELVEIGQQRRRDVIHLDTSA